jgi:nitrogen regulatory protein PII
MDVEFVIAGFMQRKPAITGILKTLVRATMKLIKAIIRPNKLEEVKDALTKVNISGMTVTEVRGHGRQKGHKAVYRGTEYNVTLLPKIMIEVVVSNEMLDDAVKTIVETGRTGEIGDGRVFVFPVDQAYHIRSGERDVV